MNDYKITSETLRTDSGLVAVKVMLYEEDTIIQQSVMSLCDYITFLQQSAQKKEPPTNVEIGEIPDGFVDGYKSTVTGTLGAVIRVPSQKHQFVLAEDKYNQRTGYYIPMPNLIYQICIHDWYIQKFQVFCYKEWKGTDTDLYQYPFGNVSSSGDICMGNISTTTEEKGSFLGLRDIIEKSLCGITNDDYLKGGIVRLLTSMSQHDFAKMLTDTQAEEFPHHLLLPVSASVPQNVGDLLEQLKK